MSVAVLGTLALDTVKTPYGRKENILGGSAAHFAMAARFFTNVNLVTIIGEDFPKKYIDFLRNKGIVLSSVMIGKGPTFSWHGEYKEDFNTAITLSTELGVLSVFKPRIAEHQRWIEYLFLANIDPDIQRYLLRSMRALKLVGLDSMNYWIRNKRKSLIRLLKEVDIYLANEAEARELSGEYNLIKAAKSLKHLGPPMIVIKKGEHGILFYCDKFIFSLPAYPVHKLVDPTGAGDTFAGGFMGYLAKKNTLRHRDIKRAIAYGVACASFSVEGFGLKKISKVRMKDINARFNGLKKIINF
jgi:sugar/nucleoside kinase (ribokinase family)